MCLLVVGVGLAACRGPGGGAGVPGLGERHHVVDVQGPGAGDFLAVVVGDPRAAGQLAAGLHRRCDDRLGDEDLVAGVAPVGLVLAGVPVLEGAAGVPGAGFSCASCTRPTASARVVTSAAGAAWAAGAERRGTRARESALSPRTSFLITMAFYRPRSALGDAGTARSPGRGTPFNARTFQRCARPQPLEYAWSGGWRRCCRLSMPAAPVRRERWWGLGCPGGWRPAGAPGPGATGSRPEGARRGGPQPSGGRPHRPVRPGWRR
ncbi:hypothetical protein YUWDRAFT_06787 [Streptomyces sp. AmelKG-D3]|nr:hypothetical protein YUWDRAFT_06787 [Streptomyces sp. AmelKG-D3]